MLKYRDAIKISSDYFILSCEWYELNISFVLSNMEKKELELFDFSINIIRKSKM